MRVGILQATRPKITMPQGLVGYWPLDLGDLNFGSGIAYDRSGKNNHGTLQGIVNADVVAGKVRQALTFSGHYISTNALLSNITSSRGGSVCLWAYHNNAFNGGAIEDMFWACSTLPSTEQFQMLHYSDNNLYMGRDTHGRVSVAASAANWPQQQWTHYCVTWEIGGLTIAWVNAKIIASGLGTTAVTDTDGTIKIGNGANGSHSGRIDDVRVYSYPLSAQQLLSIYEAGRCGRS